MPQNGILQVQTLFKSMSGTGAGELSQTTATAVKMIEILTHQNHCVYGRCPYFGILK
jgi:hypothetical protein